MELTIRQLLRILWWGIFNQTKSQLFLDAVAKGMSKRSAYERASKFKKKLVSNETSGLGFQNMDDDEELYAIINACLKAIKKQINLSEFKL